ncbi:MAG: hypothetical protein PH343_03205 [Nitrospira sp.]|nr:hypothetical protein [Nitrospira sp.]
MKRSGLPPLWAIIVILFIIGISEIGIRVLNSKTGIISLSNATLFIWGVLMLFWGIFSILSYFFETKWRGFYGLIWVYKHIIPIGGRINAIILGIIGILTGAVSLIWLITH